MEIFEVDLLSKDLVLRNGIAVYRCEQGKKFVL
jgi:hypothetical protein